MPGESRGGRLILVDPLVKRAKSPLGPQSWCHMVSDTSIAELHEFAAKIGMKRAWFQGDHYDLVAVKRDQALLNGAVAVTPKQLVNRMVGMRGDRMRELLDQDRD